jgi:hypothetical protein
MAVPATPTPFLVRLTDGRTWRGVEFETGGFVCVHHPDEINLCSIAVTLTDLLNVPQGHPMYGAKVEER